MTRVVPYVSGLIRFPVMLLHPFLLASAAVFLLAPVAGNENGMEEDLRHDVEDGYSIEPEQREKLLTDEFVLLRNAVPPHLLARLREMADHQLEAENLAEFRGGPPSLQHALFSIHLAIMP
jgi:hypothetical protein